MKNLFFAIFSFTIMLSGASGAFSREADAAAEKVAAAGAGAANAGDNDHLLETIGATTSASLYLGYLSLASIRDNVESQRYDNAQVEALIGSVVETISIVTTQLRNMKNFPHLTEADSLMIADMSEISALLEDEAMWLKRYARTQSRSDLENFSDIQGRAWEKLKLLFGNDEEKQ